MKLIIRYLPCILEVTDVPGFEVVLLVEMDEKGCDRVCVLMFDVSASKS